MSTWLLGLLVVGGSVAVALAGLYAVRRIIPAASLEPHRDMAGFLFGALTVTYAVLLAFVVVAVWDDFNVTETAVSTEANRVEDMYRLAQGLPPPVRQQVRGTLHRYARSVVEDEWPAMSRFTASPRVQAALDDLWRTYTRLEPRGGREGVLYEHSLTALTDLVDQRRGRLLASRHGLPPILWFLLIGGGLVTVGFTYSFGSTGTKNLRPQALMTGAFTMMVAFILFLVGALDYPFTGDVAVRPDAFRYVIQRMDDLERGEGVSGAVKKTSATSSRYRPPASRHSRRRS